MKKYNITDTVQFPDISRFDPVARAICLRPGQLCHIVRPSKTAINADYYRMCV
jgi:DNA-directed RNA polymerase subunit H (RpoH/RPB5)